MHLVDDRSTGTPAASGGGCWRFVADTVMGGVSTGTMSVETVDGRPALRLRGQVSQANGGGFIQIALDLPARPASPWRAIELDVTGDGGRYGLHLRTTGMTRPWQSLRASFEAPPWWQTLTLPIEAFVPRTGFEPVCILLDGERVALAPNVSLVVADRARLKFTTVQLMGDEGLLVNHQRVHLGNDATLQLGEVGLGGRYARLDLGIELAGNGSSVDLAGLSFGEHRQVMDYRVLVDHIGHDTSSNVFIKGAVEDEAQSVFTGLLRIEPHAFRTSAFETNRNLVLSPGAKAHSVPNLEILCDDVVCGHGSSVGPLEEEHLYYLESRGLSKPRAERVLISGFFSEIVGKLPVEGLAEPLLDVVTRRFAQAQEEGRVK